LRGHRGHMPVTPADAFPAARRDHGGPTHQRGGREMRYNWRRPARLSAGLLLVGAGIMALATGTANSQPVGGQPAPSTRPYGGHGGSRGDATAAELAAASTRPAT